MPVDRESRGSIAFFVLAAAISWSGWLGVLTLGARAEALLALVAVGPAVAAMVESRRDGDSFWSPLTALSRWSAPVPTYLLALALPLGVLALGNYASRMAGIPSGAELPPSPLTWTYLAQCVLANPLEEIGWRGFALPRLGRRLGPLFASLIVGVAWALWHWPMFLWMASPMHSFPVLSWAAMLVAESFLLTWLYFRSGRSVTVVSVFHVTVNLGATLLGVSSFTTNALIFAMVAAMLWWHSAPRADG